MLWEEAEEKVEETADAGVEEEAEAGVNVENGGARLWAISSCKDGFGSRGSAGHGVVLRAMLNKQVRRIEGLVWRRTVHLPLP